MSIISGNSIQLFIKEGQTYKTIAHSTDFELSLSIDYQEVKSKDDDDDFVGLKANNVTWELTGGALVVDDSRLFDMMVTQRKIKLCYGVTDDGELPQEGYMGWCIITNLSLEAPAGDSAKYSYTLQGNGELKYGNLADMDDDIAILYRQRQTAPFAFQDEGETTVIINDDNDYTLPDLYNPNDFLYRVKIEKIQ